MKPRKSQQARSIHQAEIAATWSLTFHLSSAIGTVAKDEQGLFPCSLPLSKIWLFAVNQRLRQGHLQLLSCQATIALLQQK
jgi:hypothetical protein